MELSFRRTWRNKTQINRPAYAESCSVLLRFPFCFKGLNSLLLYEILPGAGYEKFKMNSDSGELVTAASLDRETQEVFSIKGSSVKCL